MSIHRLPTKAVPLGLALALAWWAHCGPAASTMAAAPPEKPVTSSKTPANTAAEKPTARLSREQQQIAAKYRHLEDVLLRMAELNAATDPRRAALLKMAVGQSKEQLIATRINQLVELLDKGQLARALENQTVVEQDLQALLDLLLSENRAKHLEAEKARIRNYLKQVNRLIKQEKDVQGRTAGGDDAKHLADEQNQIAQKTGQLAQNISKDEQGKAGNSGKGGDSGKGDQPGSPQQGGGTPPSSQKKDGNKKSKDTPPAENGPTDPQDAQNPLQQRLDAAQQRMKEAEAKLAEAERKAAGEKQEEAIRELEQAKAQLEEILRQLREEEIERMLTMLEARFQQMLAMQQEVYEGTVRLDKVPVKERTHNHEIEASRLSVKESQIVVEVDKALLVLHEDGTAAAIAEATEQVREDMQNVVRRLAQAKIEKFTLTLEEDIITALKEMIAALQTAKKEQENKKLPGKPAPGQQQEPPLVNTLAELRMIRTLQMRVNQRTTRYSQMIVGEQAENPELVEALKTLAEREQRLQQITHDLQTGKNQ